MAALAQADDGGRLTFSGYGTLGLNHDDSRESAFTRDITQRPKDFSQTSNSWWSEDAWQRDTRLGLQLSYQLAPATSVTSQVVLRDQVSSRVNHLVDWMYLSLNPLPEMDFRAGRIGFDVFLMSEQRNVGYSYPWLRPPVEFYGWIPLHSIDGVDLAYTLKEGKGQWRFKLQGGRSPGMGIPFDKDVYYFESDRIATATLTRQEGPWLLKAGYANLSVGTEADPLSRMGLFSGLDTVAAGMPGIPQSVRNEAADLRHHMTWKNARMNYFNLGMTYDTPDWFVQAEWGRVSSSIAMAINSDMAYLGLARRLDDWTPYAMVSAIRPQGDVRSASYYWGDTLPAAATAADRAMLNGLQSGAYMALNSTRMNQETFTLGVRWDLTSRTALKWQWDTTHVRPNSYLLRPSTKVNQELTVNLLSAALDFVF